MDNLLREYAGTHYEYDERGNQIKRWQNGSYCKMHWDLFDRLVRFDDAHLAVDYTRVNNASTAVASRCSAGTATTSRGKAVRLRSTGLRVAPFTTFSNPAPFDALAWYQCDHLGPSQELTDPQGNTAWSAQYKAWGALSEQRSDWARQQGW